MVKQATKRSLKYANWLNSEAYFLTNKSMARKKSLNINKISAVSALKDAHGKIVIDSYALSARLNSLAWQAWRELYYMYYRYQPTEAV